MDDQPKDENAENTQVSHDFNDQINSQEYQKEKHDDRKNLKPYIKGNERKTLVDNNNFDSGCPSSAVRSLVLTETELVTQADYVIDSTQSTQLRYLLT